MTLEQLPAKQRHASETGNRPAVPGPSARGNGGRLATPTMLHRIGTPDRADLAVQPSRLPGRTDITFRDSEDYEAVDRLLRSARTGTGGSMVVRAEPGSGKAALLQYAEGQVAGMQSAHVIGVESESPLAFAGVHQLLVPFMPRLDLLPAPQRDVLRAVAGLTGSPTQDQFLLGLAMLTLLVDASRDQPLLVVVDDAHWLDNMSARLLAFVARRLQAHPIAFLIALGESAPHDTPFAELSTHCLAAPPAPPTAPRRAGQTPAVTGVPADRQVMTGPMEPGPPASPQARLLQGTASRQEAYAATVPAWRAAVSALLAGSAVPGGTGRDQFAAAGLAAEDLLDDGARYALAARWVQAERDRGDAGRLPAALSSLARAEIAAGGLAAAEVSLVEARGIAAAQDGTIRLGELTVLAWRGWEEETRAAATQLRRSSPGVDPGAAAAITQSALVVMELASGRYQAALDCALDVYLDDSPGPGTHILPDVVEAASRCGERAIATTALERLAERASATGTSLALGLLTRCRALLADDAAADDLYHEAAEYLARTGAVPQLARTLLLHGEWQRRQRRRRDARQQLAAAAGLFAKMGMDSFARRARVELSATGERASKRADGLGNELTPQESQIAQLVADGLTNRAIAVQLFISPNTVQYHLQKVFRKLSVSSRTQLARAVLTSSGRPDPAQLAPPRSTGTPGQITSSCDAGLGWRGAT